jgi:hypothetical protein
MTDRAMTDRANEPLLEAVLSPYRRRDVHGRPVPPPEWWDLSPEALDELHRRTLEARILERARDPRGRSGTVRAVMARLQGP